MRDLQLLLRKFLLLFLRASEVIKKTSKAKPEGDYTVWLSVKELLTNRDYVLLFICTNFINGIMNAVGPMISKICEPFNNYALGGPLACSFLFFGICFVMGYILDKITCFKLLNAYCCFVTFFLCFLILWAFHIKSVVVIFVAFALFGSSVIP